MSKQRLGTGEEQADHTMGQSQKPGWMAAIPLPPEVMALLAPTSPHTGNAKARATDFQEKGPSGRKESFPTNF